MATQASGLKFDQDKARMELLDYAALTKIARVLTFGAKKYDAHNWRGGIAYSRLIAAAMRHIMQFNNGENLDPESGQSHIAHAACCLMFLLNHETEHPELDDRYRREG